MRGALRFVLFFVLIYTAQVSAQEKIVFTYFSVQHSELRAGYTDDNFTSVHDLGSRNTFLPVWTDIGVVFCGENFIWRTDANGESLLKVGNGYKPTPSPSGKYFAYYAPGGIQIRKSDGTPVKLVEVDFWDDVSITWFADESGIAFFSGEKQSGIGFNLGTDSIFQIGAMVIQPVWSGSGDRFLYNAPIENENFGIFLGKGFSVSDYDTLLTDPGKNSLIPVWDDDAVSFYFVELLPDSLQDSPGSLMKGWLKRYSFATNEITVIDSSAAFTDNVYPQFTISRSTGKLYYTHLDKTGFGKIAVYNKKTGTTEIFGSDDFRNDFRFPGVYQSKPDK
ncbi:MAG: hypothetical protein AMXMBFR48_16610 [Ignavibacteriales bacterium]